MKKENPDNLDQSKVAAGIARAMANRKFYTPSVGKIALDELMFPEMKSIIFTREKRKQMLRENADKWHVKLTLKLDRLEFPELTQGADKLTTAKLLARKMAIFRDQCSAAQMAALKTSRFNAKLTEKIMDAIWNFDESFLIEYANALTHSSKRVRLYKFMLGYPHDIEARKKVSEIYKFVLSAGHIIDQGSFYSLCREIGLPVV